VLRDKSDDLRVFHNVCSHRGEQLVSESCQVQGMLRCPYHSWTYGLDGQLRGTPHIGGVGVHEADDFDRARHGLKPVRSALWLDLIFVNLSGDAIPFEEHIAPLMKRWEGFWGEAGFELLRRVNMGGSLELRIRANWKLAVENYCESYHLPWVHPGLNTYSRLEDHYHIFGDDLFSGQGSTAYNLADVAGTSLPTFPAWPRDKLRHAEYLSLYPNVLLGLQADHFFAMVLEPEAPDSTRETLQVYYVGDDADSDAFAAARSATLESWRVVFAEDVRVVEGMQKGRASPGFKGGVFSAVMDTPTHHFHRWVASRAAGSAV
jgi:choline monooxygenase